jgi:Sigma-70, region 4
MSPLSALAPDQRAVLELLLRQGRDYAELSELLGLPESGVRSRAHAALAALAPDRVAPVGEDGAVADWILGQQDDEEAERTRGAIARMPAWHAWASDVTDRLSEVEGAELPELPQPEADASPAQPKPAKPRKRDATAAAEPARRARPVRDGTAAAGAQHARRRADAAAAAGKSRSGSAGQRQRPVRERPAAEAPPASPGGGVAALRSSRRGGLALLAAAALAIAVVLFFVFRDGGDDSRTASSGATPTPTATGEPEVVREVALKGRGNKAQGLMRVFKRDEGGLVFALAADKVPPNKAKEVYAVWFTKKGVAPRNLGFSQSQVGKEGVFTTGGPQQGQEAQFAKWLADYDTIVVARASSDSASARKPGPVVLSGTLPGGQD